MNMLALRFLLCQYHFPDLLRLRNNNITMLIDKIFEKMLYFFSIIHIDFLNYETKTYYNYRPDCQR